MQKKYLKYIVFNKNNKYFISISAKCIFSHISNEIVEYEDLDRNKDDL